VPEEVQVPPRQPCATFNGEHSEQVVRLEEVQVSEEVQVPPRQPCATSVVGRKV
jgi:hypothetical protein